MRPPDKHPGWMSVTLGLAAAYNVLWGGTVVLAPALVFDLAGMPRPRYPELWQCIGMLVGVYGVAYALAARNPLRHWPIVLAGLLGKVLGPMGFVAALWQGRLPWAFGIIIVTNDLVWWLPFGIILLQAARRRPRAATDG